MSDYINPRDNYIHPTALIAPGVKMGTGNYIGPYCMIGFPAEHKAYWGKKQMGVEIGDDCVITGHVTIDSGTEGITTIADRCWLLKHSHVGHDALICQGSTVSCGAKIGGHAIVGLDCNIGLNACIHQWVNVPQGCMIGMNAAVTKKLEMKPFRKYAGVPAKDIGSNVRIPRSTDEFEIVGIDTQRVSSLDELIKVHNKFKILGQSGEKLIFILTGVKDSPVMIYNNQEGKVYTSGLGLLCPDMPTLLDIIKLLGHE